MPRNAVEQTCLCRCAQSSIEVAGNPLLRFVCHCDICKSVYGSSFADVTVLLARQVTLPAASPIQFRRYRRPPALRRGTCTNCGAPAVGFLRLAPWVQLAFIPSMNFPLPNGLPPASAHVFYDRRMCDVSDSKPKVSGYWRSQWTVTSLLLQGVFRTAH